MSEDDHVPILVDHNMNTIEMGLINRQNQQDGMLQCDRVPKQIQHHVETKSTKHSTTYTSLKSSYNSGKNEVLQTKDMKVKSYDRQKSGDSEPSTINDHTVHLEAETEHEEETHLYENEAEEKYEEQPLETVQRRVCLVKRYAWLKEEMSRTTARSIAGYLFQEEQKLLSRADHESICHCSWRREAVEQLLKKVLMGPCDIHDVFIRALKEQEETHIAKELLATHASESEVELFTILEKSSLHQCPRPHSHEPRFTLSNSDNETLLYYLNNKNVIDSLNDHFLSRFVFSIREHTNVCHCVLERERGVQLLLDTMKQCADSIFCDFCQILGTIEMDHVIRKLEKRKQGEKTTCRQRQKRKVDTSQVDPAGEEPSSSSAAKRLCVDSSMEVRVVSSLQRSSSTLRMHALDQIGFDVENINKGSIVIQLCPKMEDSWSRLKENCASGKIKEFIPVVYNNEAIQDMLQEGEYRLQFTIYTLPIPPESEEQQKVMFHLETEPEKVKETSQQQENPIEDHMDLLCEELEISKDLLSVLKKEKLVEGNIKEEIDKQGSRAKKIKYLLKIVGSHGTKAYEILKDFIKEDNEDLYKALVTRDGVKAIDKKMDAAAKVTKKSRSSGSHRGVFKKELFFSGIIVLKVTKKGDSPSKENLNPKSKTDDYEISCPEIINPVCHFNSDKGQSAPSGEVTMILEEAWSASGGDKQHKPERDILIGKRKKRTGVQAEERSCKRAESEEKPEEPDSETTTDNTDLNSSGKRKEDKDGEEDLTKSKSDVSKKK